MGKFIPAIVSLTVLAAACAYAADPPRKDTEAARESSKADWLEECIAAARQRDASVTESAARSTCRNTTGSGSATRAKLPGHSGPPAEKVPAK